MFTARREVIPMKLVYASRTGNVKRFIGKVHFPSDVITDELTVDEPFVLLTYTDKFGQVPELVTEFLERSPLHKENLQGVAASGNRNWGNEYFARSADIISEQYNVPVLHKFELAGFKKDVETFTKRVEEIK